MVLHPLKDNSVENQEDLFFVDFEEIVKAVAEKGISHIPSHPYNSMGFYYIGLWHL
jgi:hypothetical protein